MPKALVFFIPKMSILYVASSANFRLLYSYI